jgi:hypothetical protein
MAFSLQLFRLKFCNICYVMCGTCPPTSFLVFQENPRIVLKMGHGRVLQHYFQFTIWSVANTWSWESVVTPSRPNKTLVETTMVQRGRCPHCWHGEVPSSEWQVLVARTRPNMPHPWGTNACEACSLLPLIHVWGGGVSRWKCLTHWHPLTVVYRVVLWAGIVGGPPLVPTLWRMKISYTSTPEAS